MVTVVMYRVIGAKLKDWNLLSSSSILIVLLLSRSVPKIIDAYVRPYKPHCRVNSHASPIQVLTSRLSIEKLNSYIYLPFLFTMDYFRKSSRNNAPLHIWHEHDKQPLPTSKSMTFFCLSCSLSLICCNAREFLLIDIDQDMIIVCEKFDYKLLPNEDSPYL